MFVSAAGAPPRRIRRVRRASTAAAAIAVAGLVSTGCAAGQIAQTADQRSVIDGINVSVRTMDLRIVALQSPQGLRTNYPEGSSAPFKVVFVNNARTPDRLVDIRTDAAGGWVAYRSVADTFNAVENTLTTPTATASASAAPSSATPSGTAGSSGSESASESGSASGSASNSESASESESSSRSASESGSESTAPTTSAAPSTTTPTGVQSVTIPSGGRVGFGTPEATGGLVLQRLTRTLRPADTIKVTFTFANAGSVTVPVTVQVAVLGRTTSVGEPEGEEEGG